MKPIEPVKLEDCDADAPRLMWVGGKWTCRCGICTRCKRHTGNSNQGHYWAYCKVTGTKRDFHFCCPEDCALEESGTK